MQPPLQSPTKLAGRMDRLGLCLLVLIACFVWFYYLYGSFPAAVLSSAAMTVLILKTIRLGEKRTLHKREKALRRRIGGEMAVDSLMLQTPTSAASNAATWLSQVLTLSDFEPKPDGILATHENETVFITCVQQHASSPTGCDATLACVRNARRENADICIACSTSDFAQEAILLVEDISPKTRLLGRSGLIELAGVTAPASDEQLRALGKRRQQKFRRELFQARILDPAKKRRYLLYGTVLSLMYLLTRQLVHLIPAMVCLILVVLCQMRPKRKFSI